MKKLSILLGLMILVAATVFAQQITLFDSDEEARAYIDYNKNATIFMWEGTPVAFIEKNGNDLCIFGFNGIFLGWYENGIIYDKKGYAVGAKKESISMVTRVEKIEKFEKIKGVQKIIPIRPIKPIAPILPIFKNRWSNTSLTEFLYRGKK